MRPLVEPHIADLIPYIPGKPIEETEREYGVTGIAKLASNENCLGPSPAAVEAMRSALTDSHLYPDAGAYYLKQSLCEHHAAHGVTPDQLVVGNGTNELLVLMVRAFVGAGESVLIGWPSFVVYRLAAQGCGRDETVVGLHADLRYDLNAMAEAATGEGATVKMVFIANPNNPTGEYVPRAELDAFIERLPEDVILVLDEAYAEYVTAGDYPDGIAWVKKRPRTVVTRTFSKVYGLAALRVGYAICDREMADVMNRLRDPFNVNAVGQKAAIAALGDKAHIAKAQAHNAAELPKLTDGLKARGFEVTPSQCNFVLAHRTEGMPDIATLNEELLKRAVIVRPVKGYGLADAARITVGTAAENARLLSAIDEILGR